ncbi:MAG: hypothetical protein HQ593_04555 [Candidatus Omnitrophica bacterium]|nr:hypothetical protein [Candidatus Omnitrophota bacterium]
MVFFNSLPEIANPYVTGDLIKETIDYAAITEAVRYGFGWAMFPISPASMAFVLYNAFFILLFASAGYMTKKRALCKDEINNLAAPFFISILAIAFTSPLIQYIIWPIIKMQPIINEEFRAVRFVYPILYIYVGYFFKGIIHSKVGLRRVSVLLLSFSLLVVPPLSIIKNSPDSLKTVMRKFVLGTGIFSAEERGQNDFAGELLMTEDESQEGCMRDRGYLEMCRWVSENTHVDAIFLTTRHDFKFYARRATRISWSDRIYWVQKNRGELIVSWYRQYRSISDAFGANDPKRLSFIAKKYGADYIVADAGFPALRLPAVYNNEWYTVYEVD